MELYLAILHYFHESIYYNVLEKNSINNDSYNFLHNNDIHDISSIRVNLKIHKAKPFDYELIILLTYGLKY